MQPKSNKREMIGFILIGIFVIDCLSKLREPYLGFVPIVNGETLGFNIGKISFLVVGIILMISARKGKQHYNEPNESKEAKNHL